jgi:hypothetical protein
MGGTGGFCRGWRVAAAALSIAALMAGAATSARASEQAGTSRQATASGAACTAGGADGTAFSSGSWAADVPWSSVGPGWILADLARSQATGARGTLYLVSPGGRRYRLGTAPAGAALEDWSGAGTDALFLAQPPNSTTGAVIVLNLHTGKGSKFTVYSSSPYPGISFSRPTGTAILFQAGTTPGGASLPLQRLSLTGARELCYPTQFSRAGAFQGGYLENAAGTELVLGTQNGLELVSNGGQPIRTLAIHAADSCDLLNWWNSQSVAVACAGQLLAYPLSGGRPDQLTTSRDPGTFLGAWSLPSGTYAEAAACGTTWLERLNPNGTATTLTIPGAATAGTVRPLGALGAQLPLLIGGGCDGHFAYSFVDWYNPAANAAKTVIGGPAGGGGYVTGAILYPAS